MISQLKARLSKYSQEYEKNNKKYTDGVIKEEEFFRNRFNIDRRIVAVYELHYKHIREKEFTDAQLDIFIQ